MQKVEGEVPALAKADIWHLSLTRRRAGGTGWLHITVAVPRAGEPLTDMKIDERSQEDAILPETHESLRGEIEGLISSEGWTADAISKLARLDSFMKESQRYMGIGLTSLMKKAMKGVQLNDGTFIPKGTVLVATYGPIHHDEKYYPDPDIFNPFRFSRMREQDGDSVKQQYTTASAAFLPWGYGPHACRYPRTLLRDDGDKSDICQHHCPL